MLDTSIASAAWDKGHTRHEEVRAKIAALAGSPVYVCPITLAEVEFGIELATSLDATRKRTIREAMSRYALLPVDKHTATIYGEIRAKLFHRHAPRDSRGGLKHRYIEDLIDLATGKELGIQENDLWIVSVAVQYDVRFATGDNAGGMARILDAAGHASKTEFW